jgi:hypothetical protein
VTISRELIVDTRAAPRMKTRRRIAQTKVEKNIPSDEDVAPENVIVETSRRTFPNRKMKVVEAITLVKEMTARNVLKGRRRRSFDAKP